MIGIYKDKIAKYRSHQALEMSYSQAAFTAKMLTKEMIESNTPICSIITKQLEGRMTAETVLLMLYRCKQLYDV